MGGVQEAESESSSTRKAKAHALSCWAGCDYRRHEKEMGRHPQSTKGGGKEDRAKGRCQEICSESKGPETSRECLGVYDDGVSVNGMMHTIGH